VETKDYHTIVIMHWHALLVA